jgi:hypothetical protein
MTDKLIEIARVASKGKCKGCGAPLLWCVTPAEKWIPIDETADAKRALKMRSEMGGKIADKHAHWATCPDRKKFKKGR